MPVVEAVAPPVAAFDQLQIEREAPDAALAVARHGHPLVQSFRVPLPGGGHGRCWIPTADVMAAPGFGRVQVAAILNRLAQDDAALAALRSPEGLDRKSVV